jgi:hypothetical protein
VKYVALLMHGEHETVAQRNVTTPLVMIGDLEHGYIIYLIGGDVRKYREPALASLGHLTIAWI